MTYFLLISCIVEEHVPKKKNKIRLFLRGHNEIWSLLVAFVSQSLSRPSCLLSFCFLLLLLLLHLSLFLSSTMSLTSLSSLNSSSLSSSPSFSLLPPSSFAPSSSHQPCLFLTQRLRSHKPLRYTHFRINPKSKVSFLQSYTHFLFLYLLLSSTLISYSLLFSSRRNSK